MNASANIIIRNEEKRMELLLPYVANHFHDIVIIDQESTDNSVEVCKRFTDKVISDTATGFADSSRPLAMEHSDYNWIFTIDADEIPVKVVMDKAGQLIDNDVQINAILCHYGALDFSDEFPDYDYFYAHSNETPTKYALDAGMVPRFMKKEKMATANYLHGGIGMKHMTTAMYLQEIGLFHTKTQKEQDLDAERYTRVANGGYDKNVHF